MRQADQLTISQKSIESIDLMESAAMACSNEIIKEFGSRVHFHFICGPGNNGGDGLAIARLLGEKGYQVKITLVNPDSKLSRDNQINLQKVLEAGLDTDQAKGDPVALPVKDNTIIVDALFGIGLNKPVHDAFLKWIEFINAAGKQVISIDLPSGMFSDHSSLANSNAIVKASATYTFQYLKPALMMPENAPFFGKITVLDIGLIPDAAKGMVIHDRMLDEKLIAGMIRERPAFSHKGTFGHGLLIAGGIGKMGACILCAGAFLRSGAGLLTVMVPESASDIIHTTLPEAMVIHQSELNVQELKEFTTIGIGPGIGTRQEKVSFINHLLNAWSKPLVLDADALNILADNKSWLHRIPANSVLTPHPGEFRRLFGDWKHDFEKLEIQRQSSVKLKQIIVLKGKNTSIAFPDGKIYFNPTGNSGMAKGGSGDALTGLITGLISSGYPSSDAACIGVYLHGLAGDLAAEAHTAQGMTISDLVSCLPQSWQKVLEYRSALSLN